MNKIVFEIQRASQKRVKQMNGKTTKRLHIESKKRCEKDPERKYEKTVRGERMEKNRLLTRSRYSIYAVARLDE